jgi:hypothetical protein
LLPFAQQLKEADDFCRAKITAGVIDEIVSLIPDNWLKWPDRDENAEELRKVYADFLKLRLNHSPQFTLEAENAAKALI